MLFARRLFLVAAGYGFLALVPQYVLFEKNGRDSPPAITHPEYYFGFIGVALAWQVGFLVIARDPVRYRLLMLPAILEKALFGIPAVVLFALGRLGIPMFAAGTVDLLLGLLFMLVFALKQSYWKDVH